MQEKPLMLPKPLFQLRQEEEGREPLRQLIHNDAQIIAHAEVEGARFLLTKDRGMVNRCQELLRTGIISLEAMDFGRPLPDYSGELPF